MSSRDLRPGAALLLALALALGGAGCTGDMYDQHRLKPLRASEHWADGRSSRDPVAGTVARGALREDAHFFTGRVDGNLVNVMPFPVDRAVLDRGRERFRIYCAPCHGLDGEGRGMVVRRGMRQPPSFHTDRLRTAPVGHYFDVMTRGFGVMYDLSYQIDPRDRWAIAAYVRALQLSQNGTIADLPAADQERLEAAP
jgi:hypothetical protein